MLPTSDFIQPAWLLAEGEKPRGRFHVTSDGYLPFSGIHTSQPKSSATTQECTGLSQLTQQWLDAPSMVSNGLAARAANLGLGHARTRRQPRDERQARLGDLTDNSERRAVIPLRGYGRNYK